MPLPNHLNATDRTALEDFVGRLRRELRTRVVELRLFGSKARGTASPDSDIDVLVVVDDLTPQIEQRIVDLAFDVDIDHRVVISPVIFSRETREHHLWRFTTLGRDTEREGFAL